MSGNVAGQTDCASVRIERSADVVFEFLSNPENLDLWSFCTWKTSIASDGLVAGEGLHDGSKIFVRIYAHSEPRLVDFHVGISADALQPRIFARVLPVVDAGDSSNACTLMMIATRTPEMNDQRWQRMQQVHAVEVDLIRSLIESGHDHRR